MAKGRRTTKKANRTRKPPREDWAGRYPGAREIEPPGDWMEWKKEGQECVGVFKGIEPFRNGFKTLMDTPDEGLVIFSTPTLLKSQLDGVEIGQRIAVVYTGEGKDTGKGQPLKEFKVFVLDAD